MEMAGVYIKKLIEDGALVEDFSVELLGTYPLEECLLREKELAKTSLFPAGLNGNAGYFIEMTDEVREKLRKNIRERIENKTHNLLGGEIQRKRVEEGTHNFLGGEITRKTNKKRVEEGTHNFLGGEIQKKNNKERVENKTHNLLGGELQRKNAIKRVEEGTHNLLGKGFMTVYDKEEQKIISRIHKDIYHQNRDRYLTPNSREYKKIKEVIKNKELK